MVKSYQKNTEFLLLVKKHFSVIHADSYRDLETGKVIKVIDGDGLLVRKGEESLNIRLAYINAPEHNQEYGLDSKKWLENQFSNTASVIAIRFIAFDEKHGRHIADVFINGYSLSWLMVITGNAWAYYDFLTTEIEFSYLDAQYFARKKYRLGLWTNNLFPTPPWIYRAEEKGERISLFLEHNRTKIAIVESKIKKCEDDQEKIINLANRSEFNRNYCPMRYYEQVYLDQMQYAAIMCNGVNWDLKSGYNGVEGDEVNILFFQIAVKAAKGDEEAVYEYTAWKKALYKAVGKVHIPRYYEKRLTQEWVDTLVRRVENWVIKSSSLVD
ncbi:thermonuclease family protein [Nostoc sp. LPT]|uniref:thermonuclease family protein n=1 Tax=Nostoc sp. LPT TaxID=2815387 RepID=UPI001DBCC1E5|nr:thermonuclease family protein [Nostoc sp. LPT]MBN4000823.1 thermonuclease family protein [Nostoc sp. LPT]